MQPAPSSRRGGSPPIMHGYGQPANSAGPSLGHLLEGATQAGTRNSKNRTMLKLNNASIDLHSHQRDAGQQATPQMTGRTTLELRDLLPREVLKKLKLLKRHHDTIARKG